MNYPHRADYAELRTTGLDKLRVPLRSYVTVMTDVPCYFQRQSAREILSPVGEKVMVDALVLADIDPPWQSSGRITIVGRGTFVIVDVDPDVADRGSHSETMLATVTRTT